MRLFAVAIFGPTGVGKTSLSLKIAEKRGEIISVDSRQAYKYMDIGTAKPAKEEIDKVSHHLIDVVTPDEVFTAGDFKRFAEKILPEVVKRGKIPFLVGGTGLYFNALINGLSNIPPVDEEVKNRLYKDWEDKGQSYMYELLRSFDPKYSEKIHSNDKQRTLRALEVYYQTGTPLSVFFTEGKNKNDKIDFLKIGINIDRKILYDRINLRVEKMVESGLIDEIKKILDMGYGRNSPGLNAIGYKEIIYYLENKISMDEAVYEIKKNSRRYAKRQLTWFNGMDDVVWVGNEDEKIVEKIIEDKKRSIESSKI